MAKRVEDELAALHALRDTALGDPARSSDAIARLRAALASRTNLIAAKAASIIEYAKLAQLAPLLIEQFPRFMADSARSDRGCPAKTAIAKALLTLDMDAPEVYLPGARHVQMEPAFGGPADAAAELRATCVMGLIRFNHREAMLVVCDLLADREMQVRAAAARAASCTGQDSAELLLRLKVQAGDREPDVMAECFAGLLRLAPARSVEFVARWLDDADDAVRQAAALALGESRRPAAFEILRQRVDRTADPHLRRAFLLAIAMIRSPESLSLLLDQIREGPASAAGAAVAALAIYRSDSSVRGQIHAAATARPEPAVLQSFMRTFESR